MNENHSDDDLVKKDERWFSITTIIAILGLGLTGIDLFLRYQNQAVSENEKTKSHPSEVKPKSPSPSPQAKEKSETHIQCGME